jgi:hypothetical protein
MKTFITLSLMIMFTIGIALGKQIDENTAKTVGQKFLITKTRSLNFKSSSSLVLAYKAISSESSPRFSSPEVYFYVFNSVSSRGFVIVAGDDKVIPVLGYSDQKSFDHDNIPAHVAAWLDGYKNQVKYAIDNDLSSTDEIRAEWQTLSTNSSPGIMKSGSSVSPLLQTTWDQSPYYNALCPYDNQYNERTVTGCVATAMAQVLKFWNYPATGSGFHSYNSNNYGTLSADFGSTTYQWGSMPNSVSGPNDAVATLMYQCGISVDMNYGVGSQGGSGAYVISSQSPVTHCSEYALKTYFGYPSTLQGLDRSAYSESQWVSLLKTELDASRPVIYAGFGTGGGHCFVCDGYDQNDYFHFNWGWSGYYDGYFSINALDPGGTGTGGGTGGFNSGHQAIIGVQAPGGGGQTTSLQLYNSLQPSATTIYYGQAFDIWTDIINSGTNAFSGDYCAAIFDNNAAFVDFVQILTTSDPLPPGYHYTNGLTFSTTGLFSMLPGTYYIAIYYKPTGGNWYQVSDNGGYTNLVQMTVINPNDIELYDAMTVSPGTTLSQDEPVSVHLDVINKGATSFSGILDVSLYNFDGSFAYTIESKTINDLLPNYHFINGLTFSNSSLGAEPGTYLLAIQYQPSGGDWELTGSTYHQNPIFVTVQAPTLQADIYEPNNTIAQAYNLPLNFSGTGATTSTTGSNCHLGEDYDIYKIELPPGYTYNISSNLFDSPTSSQYSLDGIYSYTTDGTNWSDTDEGYIDNPIILNDEGTVYFLVSPKYTGTTGTYKFEIYVTRYPLGLEESSIDGQISVYPNPARDNFTIDLSAFKGSAVQIQLLNVLGNKITGLMPIDHKQQVKVPVENLPEGIYFILIQTDKGMISKEIVIRK